MKKALSLSLFFCFSAIANAQVVFEDFPSFNQLLEQARTQKKLVFIQIESDKCDQCNEVAMQGLSSTQLKEKYAVNFVSTKIKPNTPIYESTMEKWGAKEVMGSLYLDANGRVLFKNNMTTSLAMRYIEWADKAIANSAKVGNIDELIATYQKGDRTPAFLEQYIYALRELDRNADDVMEEYVGKLTLDSLRSHKVIKFVKEQGLPLNSMAYKAIHAINNSKVIDSIWYTMPNAQRVSINNKTSATTFALAVKTKNSSLLYNLSSFTRNIHGRDYRKGQIAALSLIANYSKAIKDTARFLMDGEQLASFIQNIPIDTIKAESKRELEAAIAQTGNNGRFTLRSNYYADELNSTAWTYYLMTKDKFSLAKALEWSKRSIDIFKETTPSVNNSNSAFMDTYAHLLYRLERYDEAIEWQTKAIEALKGIDMSAKKYEQELEKMKERKL
ncbi:MAG: tetratricopeptide repeat protein [Saprospiraceae bacterium]|nr:tetratricopeptide repeat protein [Saprospiraceae bacterium]